jgi:hypothetical protein
VRWRFWICGSLALLGSLPSTSRAYEDQATLGLAVGYAGIPQSDALPQHGIDVALSAGWGLGDAWSIQGLVGYDCFPDDRRLQIAKAGLETVYALDIVRFVPLVGAGVDGMLSARDGTTRGDFALHVLLGVDFLLNPRWLIGADARGYWVATHAASILDPFVLAAGVRAGVRFDLR